MGEINPLLNILGKFAINVQSVGFVAFILVNMNNLDNITLETPFGDLTFSFYGILVVVFAVLSIVVLATMSFFGMGTNDVGSRTITRYLLLFIAILLLQISSIYWFGMIPVIGFTVHLLFSVFIALYLLVSMGDM